MSENPVPLIATADDQLKDDGLRWCAAVGATPEVASDVAAVRRAWRTAAAVLVGDDLLHDLVAAGLPRRDHVLVVARHPADWWSAAVAVGAVDVCASHDQDRVVELLSTALDGRGEACVVATVGGVGGAGTSTLTVALGLAAHRRGLRPAVVDADPHGGGLDLVLGAERAEGLRWGDFDATRGRLDAGALDDVLPARHGVTHLTWGRDAPRHLPEAWPEVMSAAVRGFDLVAVDVPRHLGDIGVEVVGRSVLTLVVVPEEIAAVAAARHVLSAVRGSAPAVALVTVGRPAGIGARGVEEALDMPVLARVRPDRRVPGAVDRGHGPGRSRSLRRAAGQVLDMLGLGAT